MTETFEAKLRKMGRSLGVIIPSEIIEKYGLTDGDAITLAIQRATFQSRDIEIVEIAGHFSKTDRFEREKDDRY